MRAHGALSEPSRTPHETSVNRETPGQGTFREPSRSTRGGLSEPSVSPHRPDPGSRNLDLGTTSPSGGASAPAPEAVSTKLLIDEYAAACATARRAACWGTSDASTAKLLAEGIAPEHVRAGLARHRVKGLHPSTLPSLVNEAMNATPAGLVRPETRPNVPGHRAWANPADPAAAYAEEL